MGAKLFAGNLSPRTTKTQLEQFFSGAGRVASISIPVDRETGEHRGFCFVEFVNADAAERALEICDGRELDGRKIRLSWARAKGEGSERRRAKPRPEAYPSAAREGSGEPVEARRWNEAGWQDDYAERHRGRPRRHSGHGSDRKRGRGTRRAIE